MDKGEVIRITDYQPAYKNAFKALNEEWITAYFELEESDRHVLNDPQKYIIDKGGFILVALLHDEPVGVCALLRSGITDYDFELAKMAVSQKHQGKRIGWLLGQAALQKIKAAGASTLFLESNTQLIPAIRLYTKLGFREVPINSTPYKRADIRMELHLDNS